MPLITITESFFSGGETIARRVAEQLGVGLFEDRKIQERILAMGFSSEDLGGLDERSPGLFDRLFTTKPAVYLDLLASAVYDIASKGEGVITGHAAQVFLKDFNCALHVRIYASENSRGGRLAKELNLEESEAMDLVRKMDKRFQEFIQYGFNRDWNDPSGYDLIVTLDKMGSDWAVKLVTDMAKSEGINECSLDALEKMEHYSLQRRIEAALIKNHISSPFGSFTIEVTEKGKVHLSGLTYATDERKRIIAIVENVPGVSEVASDISIMPPGY